MQIIHIIPGMAEEASGPTYSVSSLCRALAEQGHPIQLAALDLAPLEAPPPFLRTFPLGFGPRRLGRSPAMNRWLRAECDQSGTAVVHNHGMWQMNSLYPAWVLRSRSIKLIQSPRDALSAWSMRWGSPFKPLFWRLLQGPALRRVDCFHATAEREREDIRRLGFRQPVAVIPNGIDVPPLEPKQARSPRTLLFLGRIHPQKGLDLLIPAWREVQDAFPDWRLAIVGPEGGAHELAMRDLAGRIGAQRVHFPGPVFGEAKLQAYREADLFVLPTHSENFGMSVAEALAAGTPALVTHGAPWSGLSAEGAGWWVEASVAGLADGLRQALSRPPGALAAMGGCGRTWMLRDFGWEEIGRRMARTYEWLQHPDAPVPEWIYLD